MKKKNLNFIFISDSREIQLRSEQKNFLMHTFVIFSDISKNSPSLLKSALKKTSLLSSISGQCTASTRPMQMCIGVSLLRFKYPATPKNYAKNVLA